MDSLFGIVDQDPIGPNTFRSICKATIDLSNLMASPVAEDFVYLIQKTWRNWEAASSLLDGIDSTGSCHAYYQSRKGIISSPKL